MRQFLYATAAVLMLSGTALAAGGAAGGAGAAGGGAAASSGAAAGGGAAGGAGGGAAAGADTKTVGDPNAYTPSTDPSGSAVTPNTARESTQGGRPRSS